LEARPTNDIFEPNMRSLFATALLVSSAHLLSAQDGATLYERNCASCHNGAMDRAPAREVLKGMSAERVLGAMESGPMITMAVRLSAAERRTLAEFVTQKSL
jgi:mono/diheme cytochrome c family protein